MAESAPAEREWTTDNPGEIKERGGTSYGPERCLGTWLVPKLDPIASRPSSGRRFRVRGRLKGPEGIVRSEPGENEGSNWPGGSWPALIGETDVLISKEIGTRTGGTEVLRGDQVPDTSFPDGRRSRCRHVPKTSDAAKDSVRGCVTHATLERRS
jgi:hypothetical protein